MAPWNSVHALFSNSGPSGWYGSFVEDANLAWRCELQKKQQMWHGQQMTPTRHGQQQMWCLNKLEFVTNGHVLLVQGLQRNIFWTCSCFDYVYENLTEPEAVDPKNNCLSCFNHVLSFLSIMFVYHYFIIIVTMFYNTKLHCKDTKCSDSMQCKARRTTVSQTKNPTLMFFPNCDHHRIIHHWFLQVSPMVFSNKADHPIIPLIFWWPRPPHRSPRMPWGLHARPVRDGCRVQFLRETDPERSWKMMHL